MNQHTCIVAHNGRMYLILLKFEVVNGFLSVSVLKVQPCSILGHPYKT